MQGSKRLLKGSYDAIFKIIILFIWCKRMLTYFNVKTCCFLQSPSFRQAQSALIGQLTQCIVIDRTPQACI